MATSDITGRKNGMMTVIGYSHTHTTSGGSKQGRWKVQCDCGAIRIMASCGLARRFSCGCQRGKNISSAKVKHGCSKRNSRTTEHRIWGLMLNRCNNPKNPAYPRYGGRGITVCERWHTFENFLNDMGHRPPDTTLDRRDNDKGYCLENCRWATHREQQNNKSSCRYVTVNGTTQTVKQWSRQTGINACTITYRLKHGVNPSVAIDDKENRCHRLVTVDGETKHLAEWGRISGIKPMTIAYRLKKGMPPKDAIFLPLLTMSESGKKGASAKWGK